MKFRRADRVPSPLAAISYVSPLPLRNSSSRKIGKKLKLSISAVRILCQKFQQGCRQIQRLRENRPPFAAFLSR